MKERQATIAAKNKEIWIHNSWIIAKHKMLLFCHIFDTSNNLLPKTNLKSRMTNDVAFLQKKAEISFSPQQWGRGAAQIWRNQFQFRGHTHISHFAKIIHTLFETKFQLHLYFLGPLSLSSPFKFCGCGTVKRSKGSCSANLKWTYNWIRSWNGPIFVA